ncbi:hypothetical protein D3C77_436950 [compost metagenome]
MGQLLFVFLLKSSPNYHAVGSHRLLPHASRTGSVDFFLRSMETAFAHFQSLPRAYSNLMRVLLHTEQVPRPLEGSVHNAFPCLDLDIANYLHFKLECR